MLNVNKEIICQRCRDKRLLRTLTTDTKISYKKWNVISWTFYWNDNLDRRQSLFVADRTWSNHNSLKWILYGFDQNFNQERFCLERRTCKPATKSHNDFCGQGMPKQNYIVYAVCCVVTNTWPLLGGPGTKSNLSPVQFLISFILNSFYCCRSPFRSMEDSGRL